MKAKLLLSALIVAIALNATAFRAGAQTDDRAAISRLYQQFATAFRHRDVDAVMSLYVHNNTLFVFDVGTPREHVGWDSYRADWKTTFAGMKGNPGFTIGELKITIAGDTAYTSSIQTVAGNLGNLHKLVVRVTDVLRKVDGKWLIVQEHVSVPIDLDTLKPDFMSRP